MIQYEKYLSELFSLLTLGTCTCTITATYGDQSWVFIGRIDAEAETPILWPPHAKS